VFAKISIGALLHERCRAGRSRGRYFDAAAAGAPGRLIRTPSGSTPSLARTIKTLVSHDGIGGVLLAT